MKRIPLEILFGEADKITPQISPDGKQLAWLAATGGVLNIYTKAIGRNDDRQLTFDQSRSIIFYRWSGDGRRILYLLDKGGDEKWRLHDVEVQTGFGRDLTPFPDVSVQILAVSSRHPDLILVVINHRDPQVYDVYRLELSSGNLEMVVQNPGFYSGWLADGNLTVRAALSPQADGSFDLVYRDKEEAAWRTIINWSSEDIITCGPVAFEDDAKRLLLIDSHGSETNTLISYDVEKQNRKIIAKDHAVDINQIMLDPESNRVQAVSFFRERNQWLMLDDGIVEDFNELSACASGDFYVISRDLQDRFWIVCYDSDVDPVAFYLYCRENKTCEYLFNHNPQLSKYALAPMRPITLKARDGLTLHGYLTMPRTGRESKPALVVKIHGGPWARDYWGFDPEVQWLADCGYACLQINFRSSTGYGKSFVNAGNGQWGRKMVDDLVDAANWAAENADVDARKMALLGVSYGGYAALTVAALYPDLFRCVVDIAGPTDLAEFIQETMQLWAPYESIFRSRVGDVEKDAANLKAVSPITLADQIRTPVMIVHGLNDARVDIKHSQRMVEALRRNNTPVLFYEYQDEGHSIGHADNRLQFYTDAEKFLKTHLA